MPKLKHLRASSTRTQTLLLFCLFLLPAPSAQAGLTGQCVRYFTQLALPYAVEHHSGKTIRPKNSDTDPTFLLLGERIGLGDRGGLYRINPSSRLPGISKDSGPLVAKIPHTVRFSKDPTPHAQAELEMKREVETYERLKTHWNKVEGDPKYPKDPAWEKGVLPTAAIFKTFESREGTVLVKPEIQGPSLKKLYDHYKGKLPTDMENSLREIYSTIDAISSQVKTPIQDTNGNWSEGRPFYTDINPANLVWVSDTNQMKSLGLKRPSFIFYEMTPLINRMPQYLPLTDSSIR